MIDKTIQQYKELAQLQEFAQAQQTTIIQLSKKLQRIEEERDHLKQLLESSIPIIQTEKSELEKMNENDSEFICTMEIGKLKKITLERELTLEESRKLETYFKILTQVNSRNKQVERDVQKLPDDKLLELVKSDANGPK